MKSLKIYFSAFAFLGLYFLSSCSKDTSDLFPSTRETLVKNTWTVAYYYNSLDMTNEFNSSKLLFSETGAVAYEKDGEIIPGKWSREVDASNNELIGLEFNTSDPKITQLNKSWKLTSQTTSSLQFEETGTTNILFRLKTQ